MHYRNPKMSDCIDKYEVREYVKSKGLEKYLVKLYGVFGSADEIDFSILPDSFIVKSTSGGGGLKVIIVRDKNHYDITRLKETINSWCQSKKKKFSSGREWAYNGIRKTRIVIEELLKENVNEEYALTDYKLMCFNGRVAFSYIMSERILGKEVALSIVDKDFNLMDVYELGEKRPTQPISCPDNYPEMVRIAEKLSEDFPHVRVDLYNIKGKIYFGELTFYDESGYNKFVPDSFDYQIGKLFDISSFYK